MTGQNIQVKAVGPYLPSPRTIATDLRPFEAPVAGLFCEEHQCYKLSKTCSCSWANITNGARAGVKHALK